MPGPREFLSSQAVDQDGDADASETERRGRRHVGDGSDDNDVDHDVGHDDDDEGGAEVAELPAYSSRGAARIVTASRAGRVRLFFAISHRQWVPRRTHSPVAHFSFSHTLCGHSHILLRVTQMHGSRVRVCSAHVVSPLTHLLPSHVSPVLAPVFPAVPRRSLRDHSRLRLD